MTKYKSIFISDLHLGSKYCKSEILNDFLKNHECEQLFLVGDIIDGWKIRNNKFKWRQSYTNVVKNILKYSNNGTEVIYIVGNHDEFIRPYLKSLNFGSIQLRNFYVYESVSGKTFFVTHGDMFDGASKLPRWLGYLGDTAYDIALGVNHNLAFIRNKFGYGYWSLSSCLKSNVKSACKFIFEFTSNMVNYAKAKGYDGIICGHIHTPEINEYNGIVYMNSGEWVESCSALVEHYDGRWEIIYWENSYEDKNIL
jgi:UDP-2,3-diacylglucosamine pyrophosphatase LpxH